MQYIRPLFIAFLLCALGWGMFFGAGKPSTLLLKPRPKVVVPEPDWGAVDQDVRDALTEAREHARGHGQRQLDFWQKATYNRFKQHMEPWLYDYWSMQKLAYCSLWKRVTRGKKASKAYLQKKISREFNRRVLRPEVVQLEIDRIAKMTASEYINQLESSLRPIPAKYNLSRADWESYTTDLATMMSGTKDMKQVPLTLKLVTTGSGVLMANTLSRVSIGIGNKLSGCSGAIVSSLGVRMAGGTTARLVSCATGPAGILFTTLATAAWEYADYSSTKKKMQKTTRANVIDYLDEITKELLDSSRHGVMAGIYQFEAGILEKLEQSRASNPST